MSHIKLTPQDIRAARAYMGWEQEELATRSHTPLQSIADIEADRKGPTPEESYNIKKTFRTVHIEFLETGGFQCNQDLISTFVGYQGIREFFDDVYHTVRHETKSEILKSGTDENKFVTALEKAGMLSHRQRMASLSNVHFKVLISETDDNPLAAPYQNIEYRKVPQDSFVSVPFYLYGGNLAIILWDDLPKIILLKDPELTAAYRKQFALIWEKANPC